MQSCQWFALCPNDADGTVSHPILGDVPCCQRCADKLDMSLVPFEAGVLYARLTKEGTATAETAVCADHLSHSEPSEDTVTEPVDCSGNEALHCVVCGKVGERTPAVTKGVQ